MPVEVESDRNVGVSEIRGERLRVHPSRNHERGERMPPFVEGDPLQLCRLPGAVRPPGCFARVERTGRTLPKHETLGASRGELVLHEIATQHSGYRDSSSALRGLRADLSLN